MELKPGKGRIICIEKPKPQTTESGLHLVEHNKGRPTHIEGIVVGSDSEKYPKDSYIYFDVYSFVQAMGTTVFIVKEEDVLCQMIFSEEDLKKAAELSEKEDSKIITPDKRIIV